MNRTQITIHDPDLYEGMLIQATRLKMRVGAYILSLVQADLVRTLQYKLVAYWSDGKIVTETDFYSPRDFMKSLRAYRDIYGDSAKNLPRDLLCYEAWQGENLLQRQGEIPENQIN